MSTFLILATLLSAVALLFVLPTLLRGQVATGPQVQRDDLNLAVLRDQLRELDVDLKLGAIGAPAYQVARHELERRVLEDVHSPEAGNAPASARRWVGFATAVALPALAAALYLYLGTPAGIDPVKVSAPVEASHAVTDEQIANMVAGLSARLKTNPNDAQGWSMLARSYSAMSRFSESAAAYAQLVKLVPDNAEVLADYADTLAMAQNKTLLGEPEQLVQRALQLDPNNLKALSLAGSGAFERRDYAQAIAQWEKIMALELPESDIARSTRGSINEARALAGMAPATPARPVTPAPVAAPAAASRLGGVVNLDPALRARVADTDTVFIFARAVEGPPFPLAVLRKQVKDLPFTFVLDDSMSMTPGVVLSGFAQVVVGARISKSASATPGAGDFEGLGQPVKPGAQGLTITINAQRK